MLYNTNLPVYLYGWSQHFTITNNNVLTSDVSCYTNITLTRLRCTPSNLCVYTLTVLMRCRSVFSTLWFTHIHNILYLMRGMWTMCTKLFSHFLCSSDPPSAQECVTKKFYVGGFDYETLHDARWARQYLTRHGLAKNVCIDFGGGQLRD